MYQNDLHCYAAISKGDGTFMVDTIQISPPASNEVLVKMKAAGICHTDYDSLSWGKPVVLGHEGAGIVEKVGDNVETLKIGDRVVLNWATPCGECFQCMEDNQHLCEQNSPVIAGANGYTPGHATLTSTKWNGSNIERSFNLGTLGEYALVHESAVVKINNDALSFPSASIISCGVMTGYGSVVHAAKVNLVALERFVKSKCKG